MNLVDKAKVNYAFDNIYYNSVHASIKIEEALYFGPLRVGLSAPSFPAFAISNNTPRYFGFNPTQIEKIYIVNDSGQLQKTELSIVVAHELSHYVDGITADDPVSDQETQNSANFDFLGQSVQFERDVAIDLGIASAARVSYHGALLDYDSRFQKLMVGVSYSEENAISIVRLGDEAGNLIDDNLNLSARIDINSVIQIGFGGHDTIIGQNGQDWIYGGDDDDYQLGGGDGSDVIYGGNGADTLSGGDGDDKLFGGESELFNITPADGFDTLYGDAGSDVLTASTEGGELYGGDDNDLLIGGVSAMPSGEMYNVLAGDGGDDIMIVGSGLNYVYAGAGDDLVWVDRGDVVAFTRTPRPGDPQQPFGAVIADLSDGDASDTLVWNGYVLQGGIYTSIDNGEMVHPELPNQYFAYLDTNGVMYAMRSDNLWISLPTNSTIIINYWENGDFGITLDLSAPWNPSPESAIWDDGNDFNYSDLPGRIASLAAAGPMARPTEPKPDGGQLGQMMAAAEQLDDAPTYRFFDHGQIEQARPDHFAIA